MKAEHRKELQTNVLADRLGKLIQGLREGFHARPSNTSLMICGGLIAVLVLVIGWNLYSKAAAKSRSAEWLQIDEAANVGDLERIVNEHGSKPPTRIARFQLARVHLRQGMEDFCSTTSDGREKALEHLRQAADLYGKLADEVKDTPVLAQEALLGVGKAREALNELDPAQQAYQKLVERYPDSVNGKEAAGRLKKLEENKSQVGSFYTKLNELAAPATTKKE
jgi:tetratricopeptide (TPR) repeat protein